MTVTVEEYEAFIEDVYLCGRISKKERKHYLNMVHDKPIIEIANVSIGVDSKPEVQIIYMPDE
jgi:hypothetical protein